MEIGEGTIWGNFGTMITVLFFYAVGLAAYFWWSAERRRSRISWHARHYTSVRAGHIETWDGIDF